MDLFIKNITGKDYVCDVLILPVMEGSGPGAYKDLGKAFPRLFKKVFSKEFRGKKNEVLLLPAPEDIKPERLLLVGLGKKAEVSAENIRQAGGKAASYLRDMGMKKAALSTEVLSSLGMSPSFFAEGALLGLYTYFRYRKEENGKAIESLALLSGPSKELDRDISWAKTLASAVYFARDLINTPSNDMTPSHLAAAALSLRRKGVSVKVLEKKDAQKLGMGVYLSVAKGSCEPPKFIVAEYKGAKGAPVVLIGKSITFDSGGLSLKSAEGMEKMKYDMAGGAAVLGVLKAASEAKLPVHLVGILPATETLPG